MVRIAPALPAPGSIIAGLALIGLLIPSMAEAAYVQWIRCPDGRGGSHKFESLWPTSGRVRLLSSNNSIAQDGVTLEFDIRADYTGNATCAELLKDSPSDVALRLEALHLSETYLVRPSNWTCLSFEERPAWERQHRLDRASEIRLVAQHDLGALGVLLAFSAQWSFSASNRSDPTWASSACIYSEITPQLREDVSAAVRYAPVAVFLLVFVSGLFATILAPAAEPRRRPSTEAAGNESHQQQQIVQRAILPGVGDCLLYLQFVFFLGALTLRYPGFYQPLTSLFHWSALFSPTGPFGQERRYDGVNDGIYEINGTLTGSYGLELMSQITGGPMTMDVWRNTVAIAAIITAVVVTLRLLHRFLSQRVPSLGYWSSLAGKGPGGVISDSTIAREIWNVLLVVLSYFLTPIVAISAYQLDNVFLPTYHLALASTLVVLVVVGVTWMWRVAPSNQLGVLLLDSSKRYHRVGGHDSNSDSDAESGRLLAEKRDIFAVIFFGLAFVRGVAVGGLQFSPLAQVVVLGATELALLTSAAVLRPLRRRVLSVFTWSGVARLVVVALTVVFLPELDASISTRSRAAIAILVIHAAVLVFGCAVPATIRLISLVFSSRAAADEPEIYGLSQLRRRGDVVNDLSSPTPSIYNLTRPDPPISYHGRNPRSPSDGSSINFYADQDSTPDSLYLRAVPRHHYFRPPRSSSSSSVRRPHAISPSNISSPPPSSTSSTTRRTTTTTSSSSSPLEPRSSSSPEAEGGSPTTTITPLAPQWSDYSFREADLYYGHGRGPQRDETAAADAATESGASVGGRQPSSTVSRVLSSVRDQLKGRTSMSVERQPAAHRGFEVRRPPRPADC